MNNKALFNFIAPIYGLFFNLQAKYYSKVIDSVRQTIDIKKHSNIIDIGCGTGALCHALHNEGLEVTGVDSAERMIILAKHKLTGKSIELLQANIVEGLANKDKSFDIAISSYVLHGMKQEERKQMYAEMNRIAKHYVIFHDYNQKRALHTDFIEWLEGGDYFNFIKDAKTEMAEYFMDLQVLDVDSKAAWYICTPYDDQF